MDRWKEERKRKGKKEQRGRQEEDNQISTHNCQLDLAARMYGKSL